VTTWSLAGNALLNGTSMAAPSVAGGIACLMSGMLAEGIAWTPQHVKRVLQNDHRGQQRGAKRGKYAGIGRQTSDQWRQKHQERAARGKNKQRRQHPAPAARQGLARYQGWPQQDADQAIRGTRQVFGMLLRERAGAARIWSRQPRQSSHIARYSGSPSGSKRR
jgi:hypothetical protein